MATTPPRNLRALELLELGGSEDILEIGCGPGAAVEALGRAGHKGLITAIDRSDTAVQRAGQRNQQLVDRGRVAIVRMSTDQFLDDQNPLSTRRFDRIFSVNVNRFWTHPVAAETRAILQLLKPNGIFLCFYEAPLHRERRPDRPEVR